jgi:hypothetical protein
MDKYNFENFSTREVQAWCRNGQMALADTNVQGANREVWEFIVRASAAELLFRWKHHLT